MIALPLRTVLVIHIELLLCSYCPKDFCPGLQTPLFASSICHLHISCNTPGLHPPNFLISPECYSCPKRNWRQCIYRMFGGQTRCITGDVQMAIGTQSRLWGLAAIVGVEEKGVISKGTGRCSALSFATWVKKITQSGILMPLSHALKRAWQLHFLYHPCYTHVWENNDKPSPVSVGLKLCLLFSVISTHKALNSWPSTVYRYSMRRTIHLFQIIHIILSPMSEN